VKQTQAVKTKSPWKTILTIGIPVILVAAVILYLVIRVVHPPATPPTIATTAPGALDFQIKNASLTDIIGFTPSGIGNPGKDYDEAVRYARRNQTDLEKANANISKEGGLQSYQEDVCVKISELMARGTNKEKMEYTFVFTPRKLKVIFTPDGIDELRTLADALDNLCIHYSKSGEVDKVIDAASQELVLGWHMMSERARAGMVMEGISIQIRALGSLEDAYKQKKETNRIKACVAYRRKLADAYDVLQKKMSVLWRAEGSIPGDAYNIIENDKDRACRVDAILALGIQKFTAKGHRGNDRVRDELLEQYSKSSDELLSAAAESARDCTKVQIEEWFNK
jgi:hypothetical protein